MTTPTGQHKPTLPPAQLAKYYRELESAARAGEKLEQTIAAEAKERAEHFEALAAAEASTRGLSRSSRRGPRSVGARS